MNVDGQLPVLQLIEMDAIQFPGQDDMPVQRFSYA